MELLRASETAMTSTASSDPTTEVEGVLITAELASRTSRSPDYEAESRALGLLAREMTTDPHGVLQKCAELVLELCHADSSGISILEPGGSNGILRWQAAAGAFAPHLHGTMPVEASPCGTVLDRNSTLLFNQAERFFPALQDVQPRIYENLLTPWHVKGKAVGTLWAVKHTPEGQFDAEDVRMLQSLARFAAAAFQMHESEQALASDLANAERLRSLSERLVSEESLQAIYDEILSTTIAIARADAGTVQIYDPASKKLELIASQNFSRTITDYFHRVDAGSRTACGVALKTGDRALVDFPEHVADFGCQLLVGEGIQSAVAVPLISRTGMPLGMLNAHWRHANYRPNERDYRFLDLLARQAADLIEQGRIQTALRESEERQAFLLKLSDTVRPLASPADIQGEITDLLRQQLNAAWAYYVDWDLERQVGVVLRDSAREDLPTLVGAHDVSDAPEFLQLLAEGSMWTVSDYANYELLPARIRQNFVDLGFRSMMMAPLVKQGRLVATLIVGDAKVRDWSASESSLLAETAERTWAAIERGQAEAALRLSEERFTQFANASAAGLWMRNADTCDMEFVSPSIGAIYGVEPDALLGDVEAWTRMIMPEDREGALAHLDEARQGQPVTHEFRIQRPADGAVRWIRNTDFPLRDDGHVPRLGGIAEDVTEAKLMVERQGVLVAELQHRTRNIIAVVRSMADKTARASADLPDFRKRFRDRLEALARVQGLLSRLNDHDRVTFDELIATELAAMGNGNRRVRLEGPKGIRLRSSTVQTLAMAIHELATNAVKYGALGPAGGQLDVSWRLSSDEGGNEPLLSITWRESGVAMARNASLPTGSGQGRELIEKALPYQLSAQTTYELGPDGVRCTITLPVSSTYAQGADHA